MNDSGIVRGIQEVQLSSRPLHLAIGMFDGVHLGHQSVIGSAVHSARRSGGVAGVLTFWPHPSRLFRSEDPVLQIMDSGTKAQMLQTLGIRVVIEQPFDKEFAAIPADDFVTHLCRYLPSLAAIYVGENWRFGQGRQGDVPHLIQLAKAAGIDLVSAPRLQRNGRVISSTRIRELLVNGEMATANSLFGYTYFSEAQVQRGRQLGRTLGFPTVNMVWEPELKPRFGVYAVRVSGGEADGLPGVANYGLRPTVEDGAISPVLEVHLLGDDCPYTEGDFLKVEWETFLRPETKFAGLAELKAQVARAEADRDLARQSLERTRDLLDKLCGGEASD